MAHTFQSLNRLTALWPLAAWLFAWLPETMDAAFVRTGRWRRLLRRVSVPPLSSQWLAEHEHRSRQHPHDV
jgi:hypothetical protein